MGEIVLAKLGKSINICELVETISSKKRVRLKFGKNKESKVPSSRIILRTGKQVRSSQDVLNFAEKSKEIASSIDVAQLWRSLQKVSLNISVTEILETINKNTDCPENLAAVYLAFEDDPLYFEQVNDQFVISKADSVKQILHKRDLAEQKRQESVELLGFLESGETRNELSNFQKESLDHLREFAIFGSQYSRSSVAIQLLKLRISGDSNYLQRYSFEGLSRLGIFEPDEPIELERNHISTEFSDTIQSELSQPQPSVVHTVDLTDLPTYTIDDEDTLDRDDAFSITEDYLWIHISNISSHVIEGSEIDKEAFNRSSTLYIPDGKVPMLPKSISEGQGSLSPPEYKSCVSLKLDTRSDGCLENGTFEITRIRVDRSLSYHQVDKLLNDNNHELSSILKKVSKITKISKEKRLAKRALIVDRNEMKISTSEDGKVEVQTFAVNSASRDMIAELMIIYNYHVAEFCYKNQIPAAYRTQEQPQIERAYGIVGDPLAWYLTSRHLKKARISMRPETHSGLGLNKYTQASSPIRRYSDLKLQRQLVHYLKTGRPKFSNEEMRSAVNYGESQAKKLKLIESSRNRYWFLKYLKESYLEGTKPPFFQAIALENNNEVRNLFELVDYPYRSRCTLPSSISPGTKFTVILKGIDLWHRAGQFSYHN